MGAFRFSLEQVLQYRKQLEEQAMLVFAQAVQARDKRLRDIEEMEAATIEYRRKLADIASLDADERWLISDYITVLGHDLERARLDLQDLEKEVERCREELTGKSQERKLLEKLKEKQANRHKAAENQKEQQNYDDIATIRFVPPAI